MTRTAWEPPLFEWSIHGPIPVELSDCVKDENGKDLAGIADPYGRNIILDSGLPPLAMEVALEHEWLHTWLHDSGFDYILTEHSEEPWVQSLASSLVARRRFHRAGGVREG